MNNTTTNAAHSGTINPPLKLSPHDTILEEYGVLNNQDRLEDFFCVLVSLLMDSHSCIRQCCDGYLDFQDGRVVCSECDSRLTIKEYLSQVCDSD